MPAGCLRKLFALCFCGIADSFSASCCHKQTNDFCSVNDTFWLRLLILNNSNAKFCFIILLWINGSFCSVHLPVLAMRVTASPQGHLEQAAESQLQTQSRGHFSRQPVKYYRQGSAGAQLRKAGSQSQDEDNSGSVEGLVSGSADSSRSSSPDPETPIKTHSRLHETPGPQNKTGYTPGSQTAPHAGVKRTVSDEGVKAVASSFKEHVGQIDQRNTNQSNNTLGGRERLIRSLRRRPTEERTAQKVLSGLRLKRSDSGKGEQLHFVWHWLRQN